MVYHTLGERFRVEAERADEGQTFVRVTDLITGESETATVPYEEHPEKTISELGQKLFPELAAGKAIEVVTITGVGYYRDGGSYSLGFTSDDGDEYTFFVPIRRENDGWRGHLEPHLRYHRFRDWILRRFTWEEATDFLRPLNYPGNRFRELLVIVDRRGVPLDDE